MKKANPANIRAGIDALDHVSEVQTLINSIKNTTPSIEMLNGVKQYSDATIQVVDGLCGSGKTFALSTMMANTTTKYVIAVPTIKLASQYDETFKALNVQSYKAIHSENTEKFCTQKEIIKAIDNNVSKLIITQNSFNSKVHHKIDKNWNLVLDEIPTVDDFYALQIPHNSALFDKYLKLDPAFEHETIYKVQINNQEAVNEFLNKNRRAYDAMDSIIFDLIDKVNNGDLGLVYKESWDKVVVKLNITPDKDVDTTYGNTSNTVYFLVLKSPESFIKYNTTTLMGANLYDSLLVNIWSKFFGVNFNKEKTITSKLRYTEHTNGPLLKINWIQEKCISSYKLNKTNGDVSVKEEYLGKAIEHFNCTDVLFVSNVNDKDLKPLEWTECPVISHGSNNFSNFTNIYFGPALNKTPMHSIMLNQLGFDKDFVNKACSHEVMYQCIMRTALRNPDNTKEVNVVVTDLEQAAVLVDLFPGSSVAKIGGEAIVLDISRKQKFDGIKKLNELRNKYKTENESVQKNVTVSICIRDRYENLHTSKPIDETMDSINYSLFAPVLINGHLVPAGQGEQNATTPLQFVKDMKFLSSNNIIKNKTENDLMVTCAFTNKGRKKADVVHSSAIVLDIDFGDLTHQEFTRIFTEDNPYSFFVTNSASADANKDRYRAYFFVKKAMSIAEHDKTAQHLISLIDKAGYKSFNSEKEAFDYQELNPTIKLSGIDRVSKTITQAYYLPATIIGKEQYAFFTSVNCDDLRSIHKFAIDPDKIEDLPVRNTLVIDPTQPLTKLQLIKQHISINKDLTGLKKKLYEEVDQFGDGNRWSMLSRIGGLLTNFTDTEIDEVAALLYAKAGSHKNDVKNMIDYAKRTSSNLV